MPIKLIPEFWRNHETPEKFWKRYEQDMNKIFWVEIVILSSFNVFVTKLFSFQSDKTESVRKINL